MISAKQLTIYNAIIDILRVYADTEIGGQYEFNTEAIAEYLKSFACGVNYSECKTPEQVYEKFTQDILIGYPVYDMLILPDWTRNMIIKEYAREAIEAKRELEKTYKCYTCEYFEEKYIKAFDSCVYRCHYKELKNNGTTGGREVRDLRLRNCRSSDLTKLDSPKKSCKHYKRKGTCCNGISKENST